MRIPRNLVSVTCLITVFSKTSGTLTLIFFCLRWKSIKLVFDKFKDDLFAFSQIDIFVSLLVNYDGNELVRILMRTVQCTASTFL